MERHCRSLFLLINSPSCQCCYWPDKVHPFISSFYPHTVSHWLLYSTCFVSPANNLSLQSDNGQRGRFPRLLSIFFSIYVLWYPLPRTSLVSSPYVHPSISLQGHYAQVDSFHPLSLLCSRFLSPRSLTSGQVHHLCRLSFSFLRLSWMSQLHHHLSWLVLPFSFSHLHHPTLLLCLPKVVQPGMEFIISKSSWSNYCKSVPMVMSVLSVGRIYNLAVIGSPWDFSCIQITHICVQNENSCHHVCQTWYRCNKLKLLSLKEGRASHTPSCLFTITSLSMSVWPFISCTAPLRHLCYHSKTNQSFLNINYTYDEIY